MTRSFKATKALPAIMAIVMATFMAVMLPGCGDDKKAETTPSPQIKEQPEEDIIEQVTVEDIRPGESAGYDCGDSSGMTPDKRFWCRGLKAWMVSESYQADNGHDRDEFIEAWKLGNLDAIQGRTPAIENLQSHPVAADGYEIGYIGVLDAQGVIEYDCSEGDETDNEYRDRWCEAAASYNSSRQGDAANAIMRNIYINGYMAGRAIALTLPSSMESLFGSEAPKEGNKSAIDEPENDAPKSILVFHRGFTDGFQAMIDTVRESVNQVMEQMQSMPGMDGMPPPGMDGMGMPPGMEHMMPPMGEPQDTAE
ncbi:hypothetical protein [Sansalvadorimonas verongulae]|uniref:hypothetical protein n=1 Tax=Sansalvadorimonas verongulae TaxID=2172824 RepID=UPI0012BBDA4E|nr:hypothetical protein [Sansalvadorimonas verongulae]MTI13299.1 hypothetical protein [Sansalvadorimonas verongulae]